MDIFPEEKGEKLMIMKVRLRYRTWPVVPEHLYPGPGRGGVNLNRFQKDKPRTALSHRKDRTIAQRLLIISPCRDEAQFVRLTLDSVVNQTMRPDLWLIVDDGSRDRTAEIVAPATPPKYPWIRLVRRQRGGGRQLGPGVVNAFNVGLADLER